MKYCYWNYRIGHEENLSLNSVKIKIGFGGDRRPELAFGLAQLSTNNKRHYYYIIFFAEFGLESI